MIKLALCDDQVLFLRGLKYIISDFDNIEVCLEATSGEELFNLIADNMPDVLLLDMKMPGMDGLEVTKRIKAEFPTIKVILLTMYDDERLVNHVMEHGANGYLLKNEEPEIVEAAIRSVMEKDYYFNDFVAKALLKGVQNKTRSTTATMGNSNIELKLTPRESEVLQAICAERTTAEIAKELFLSVRTVEGHRKNLMEKTGVRNTAGLVIYAVKHKLVEV